MNNQIENIFNNLIKISKYFDWQPTIENEFKLIKKKIKRKICNQIKY